MANLLIVDDEEDVREFAANFFRRRKINVITADSGEKAYILVEEQKPDMVLLDIKMSGMDGIETLRRIKELDKDLKVIMVTGRRPDEGDVFDKCKQLGVLDYIHKPLELDELERIVMGHLFPSKK